MSEQQRQNLQSQNRAIRLPELRIVAAAWFAQFFAMGLSLGCYPVFIASIEREFGASRAQSSLGIPLLLLAGALVSPFLGKVIDRGSPRHVMTLGALFMGVGLALLSLPHTLLPLVTIWVGLVGIGQAMLGVLPANTLLANWFVRRRALMVAVAGTGITAGAATFPFIAEYLLATLGWSVTLRCLGLACLLLATPMMWFCVVKSPLELGLSPDGEGTADVPSKDADGEPAINFFGDVRYWLAGISLACIPAVLMTFNTHIVSWAQHLGFGRDFGIAVLSGTAVLVALSSLLFGHLCDRFGAIHTLRFALCLELIGWGFLSSASQPLWFLIGVAFLALGAGSFMPGQASLLGQLWPVRAFGRATGFVGLLIITVVFIVPTVVGVGFEATGGYREPMRWVFAALVLPLLLLTLLGRHGSAQTAPLHS